MTTGPTAAMRHNARRWLTETGALSAPEPAGVVDPATLQRGVTARPLWSGKARHREFDANGFDEANGRTHGQRVLTVWVDHDAAPTIDQTYTVGDTVPRLAGKIGTVIAVERDPTYAVPRITVQLRSDA